MEKTALDLLKEYRDIISETEKSVKKPQPKKKKVCMDCGSCPPEKGGNGYCKKCAGMNESKLSESYEESPVFYAVMRRIELSYPDMFTKYGYDVVVEAVRDVADFVGNVEEIGSSDVSIWTNQVIRELKLNEPGDF
jgi:hypothetical protein